MKEKTYLDFERLNPLRVKRSGGQPKVSQLDMTRTIQ